jgi:two-component system CheB/CheR fusion protein
VKAKPIAPRRPARARKPASAKKTARHGGDESLEREQMLAEIEALRAAQVEVEQSQQLYAELFELAPIGYVNLTSAGGIHSANNAAAALLNGAAPLISGFSFLTYVDPADHTKFASHLAQCRAVIPGIVSTELALKAPSGPRRFVELISRPSILLGSSQIIYRTVLRDITEQMMALQAESALAASQELLRLVLDNVREYAIFSSDIDRRVTSWNAGAERLLKYKEAEILGQSADIIFTGEDREALLPELEARTALAEGRASDDRWHVRKDGTRFWGSGAMMPMHDAGQTVGFVKIFRDETDIREARQEVDRSRERLWRALQQAETAREEAESAGHAKDRFLAVLSHELRTPLTPILMTTHILSRRKDLPASAREAFEMIRRNVHLEARLVDDLLDITRIARGRIDIMPAAMDMHETILQAVEISRPDFDSKNQRLILSLDAVEQCLNGDGTRLQQVVWNLLKNASKFSAEGGAIQLRTRNAAGRLVVEVSDSGIGIEPEAIERIFDPFEQANKGIARQFGGLGLGLAISKAIVEAHDGVLRAESHGPGQGATFTVELPFGGKNPTN